MSENIDTAIEHLQLAIDDLEIIKDRSEEQNEKVGDIDDYLQVAIENGGTHPEHPIYEKWQADDQYQFEMVLKHIDSALAELEGETAKDWVSVMEF